MDLLQDLAPRLRPYLPLLVALAGTAAALGVTYALTGLRRRRTGMRHGLMRQLSMLAVTVLGMIAVVVALPINEKVQGQLLGLLGLVLTGVIAFSSTTFVANAMAGLMLRAVSAIRIGDWIRVGSQFGRVTELELFHTEIQTEDRDLATLPNLYLATRPVAVVRASGTIISTTVSLGYDLEHSEMEPLLLRAATTCGLEDPFVQILELGDYSVTYRVAGFLKEVKHMLSVRSRLQASVLDVLHDAGVEIASPTLMNQRRVAEDRQFVPEPSARRPATRIALPPEERIFDKAEQRLSQEELRSERQKLLTEIADLERLASTGSEAEQAQTMRQLLAARTRADQIERRLEQEEAAEREEA